MGHTVTMWVVLTVVTILTCHLSLGQDVLSVDTMNYSGQDVLSEDTQVLEPRYSCPEVDVDFRGFDFASISSIRDWHSCGTICSSTPDCKFWTWSHAWNICFLKSSDRGLCYDDRAISGVKGCK